MRDLRPEAAEAIGTAAMLLLGGATLLSGAAPAVVALAFGGAIMVLVYALGHVCGAHFNPAITLAFAVTGHFPWRRVPSYMAAQLAGAFLAALALTRIGPASAIVAGGTWSAEPWSAAGVEVLATALLAFVILAVATDRRAAGGVAGLAIGATVALGVLAAGPLSGAAMNPARALAPAVLAWDFGGLPATLGAPLVGAVLGMLAYEAVRRGAAPRGPLGAQGPIDLEARR